MTSRMSNPKYLAEIFNKATVINFSITEDGLKDHLGNIIKENIKKIEILKITNYWKRILASIYLPQ